MRQPYAYDANESTRRLVEDEMSTGLTNTHTARGFSDRVRSKTMHSRLCITSQKLPYITILCYIDSRFFCLGTIAYGSIRLPPGSLASSRGRTLSITMGALVNKKNIPKGRLLALIGAKSNRYGTWYWIYCHSGYCYSLCDSLSQSWDTGLSVALFISVVITSSTKSMVSFTTPWTW